VFNQLRPNACMCFKFLYPVVSFTGGCSITNLGLLKFTGGGDYPPIWFQLLTDLKAVEAYKATHLRDPVNV